MTAKKQKVSARSNSNEPQNPHERALVAVLTDSGRAREVAFELNNLRHLIATLAKMSTPTAKLHIATIHQGVSRAMATGDLSYVAVRSIFVSAAADFVDTCPF